MLKFTATLSKVSYLYYPTSSLEHNRQCLGLKVDIYPACLEALDALHVQGIQHIFRTRKERILQVFLIRLFHFLRYLCICVVHTAQFPSPLTFALPLLPSTTHMVDVHHHSTSKPSHNHQPTIIKPERHHTSICAITYYLTKWLLRLPSPRVPRPRTLLCFVI